MTPIEINITIAERLGWRVKELPAAWGDAPWVGWASPCGNYFAEDTADLPDYHGDRNIMWEAFMSLDEDSMHPQSQVMFLDELGKLCDDGYCNHFMMRTTCAQWAEAFVRLIGKWEDTTPPGLGES